MLRKEEMDGLERENSRIQLGLKPLQDLVNPNYSRHSYH